MSVLHIFSLGVDDFEWAFNNGTMLEVTDQLYAINGILIPKMSEWSITINSLGQKLDTEFKRMLQLQAIFIGSINFTDLITPLQFLPIGRVVCYNLSTNLLHFKDSMDRLEISFDTSQFSYICWNCLLFVYNDPKVVFDLFNYGTEQFISDNIDKYLYVEISMNFDVVSKNLSSYENPDYCNAIEKTEVCVAKCLIDLIQENCNCSPISWPAWSSPGINDCSWAKYNDCLSYDKSEDKICPDRCPPYSPCDSVRYDVRLNKKIAPPSENRIKFAIFVSDFTYTIFEDSYKMTYQSFLASLGGMLGLVLGLDMRFLATLIFLPVTKVVEICNKRLKKNANSIFRHEKLKKLQSYYEKILNKIARVTGIRFIANKPSFLT